MARKASDAGAQFTPAVHVAHIGQLNVYMVHEHELDGFAEGSPATLAFNGAVALLSLAVALLLTVTTTTITQAWLFSTYLFCCINFFLVGTTLFVYWWRVGTSTRAIVRRIKGRMSAQPGIQEAILAEPPGGQEAAQ